MLPLYIRNIENYLISQIEKNDSILVKHNIPKLHYNIITQKPYKGLNQLFLSQNNFSQGIITLPQIIEKKIKPISSRTLVISEKNKNRINYYFCYEANNSIFHTTSNNNTCYFPLTSIEELIDYYFFCTFNKEIYCPLFSQINKNNLVDYIKFNSQDFAINVNRIFNKYYDKGVGHYEVFQH